ncbi:Septum site-determining protein MinC [Piscirickettsia salmonis]|uniref:Probable septum site-determining protein MinC n=1 Tax=Piscirickettsia salmonis TaxID=1238 RepID=A0A1L6TAS1_PISSA|nr:septum site-determining protein MinC [Piscirickettsia salmonis]AKP73618.2 septum site-determining protein MinC [Piscirickettsia salmonis LF-89 = ATCC VR-1361]ALB22389.1 septum site-determining protein MinC [Piscirickettsia salmonis]ALY02464.1 septum site-determining protein MinC [Piscirickettsia salmonis]AMA41978.1 septum site-determining protein MinC [Piscirickettsia salmonis]AMA41983.1 septum site-determining protein MinC [Piscirickettsia salmonis]
MNTALHETDIAKTTAPVTTCQLKGSLFTLTVLLIYNSDINQLEKELQEKVKYAPHFFQHTPTVLDISQFKPAEVPDFFSIQACCRRLGLIPVAVRGGNQTQHMGAQHAGFAILPAAKEEPAVKKTVTIASKQQRQEPSARSPSAQSQSVTADKAPSVTETTSKAKNKIITKPVRSGQQIYNGEGDLIILSSVSPGAELIADGNIHVYGTLKGRALAGVNGNQHARIFCGRLEAELISIAGQYKINEEIQCYSQDNHLQIYLEHNQLLIRPL